MVARLYTKKSTSERDQRNILLFLLVWLGVNLLQSYFTELAHDEAYYWMYSQNMDWGYFDHPPVIALLIKLGFWLFPNELGVRLLPCLLGAGTIYLVYQMVKEKLNSYSTFVFLTGSIILLQSHVAGFLAIPDIPVVFFATLFLYLYNLYLDEDRWHYAALLGLAGALMLYSKYHGVLVLFFTLLANLKILRRPSFWVIPVTIAGLMIPHLLWQIKNGYPTFEYHLVSRSSPYTLEHTINYLYSQLLIAGPLIAPLVLYHAFAHKSETTMDRVLKFNFAGFLFFFFLMSFKGRVEAHWTAIAFIPMVVLSLKNISGNKRSEKWVKMLFIPSIVLFLFIRVALIVDFLPFKVQPLHELHHWDKWAKQLESLAGERTVVFRNSFQRASKYTFYTNGKPAHTLNNVFYRKNQYDLWPIEDSLQNKPVLLLHAPRGNDSISTAVDETYRYELIDSFYSYYNFHIKIPENGSLSFNTKDTVPIELKVLNPRIDTVKFHRTAGIVALFYDGENWRKKPQRISIAHQKIPPKDSLILNYPVAFPPNPGKYSVYFSISTRNQTPAANSRPLEITVQENN